MFVDDRDGFADDRDGSNKSVFTDYRLPRGARELAANWPIGCSATLMKRRNLEIGGCHCSSWATGVMITGSRPRCRPRSFRNFFFDLGVNPLRHPRCTTMLHDDQQAIAATLEGNPAAYAELVERYQQRLLGLLWHACSDRELAEDIAQETFARAYRKLNLYSGEAQFYTWLARIGLNLLATNRRGKRLENQRSREGFEVAIESMSSEIPPDEVAAINETQVCVRQAIECLEEERRVVVLLRDFDGMDYAEIAATLNVPIGTVRSRLHRARLELKALLHDKVIQLGMGET